MVITTLMLSVTLLAHQAPQAEMQKGWVVEVRGYTYHAQAMPKAPFIIEFQWRQLNVAPKIDQIEAQYFDDLRPVFEQLKQQK